LLAFNSISCSENNVNNSWNCNLNNNQVNCNWNNKDNQNKIVPFLDSAKKTVNMSFSFSYEEVFAAFDNCLKHKRNTRGAKEFCVNKVSNLLKLTKEINEYTYQIGISQAFIITDPKVREVFAAAFRDRIVHHLVINELEPYFTQYFIEETFSCLRNRGTLNGIKCLQRIIQERSENNTKSYYIAKLDFQAFFMSIDKELLSKSLDDFIVKVYPNNRKKECLR